MKKKFVDSAGEVFTADDVMKVDGKLWVHYTKVETGEKYSCLLEAFSERFNLSEQ